MRVWRLIGMALLAGAAVGCVVSGPRRARPTTAFQPAAALAPVTVVKAHGAEAAASPAVSSASATTAVASTTASNSSMFASRVLKPGDRIEIQIRTVQPDTIRTVIDENGCVNMPLVGPILIGGKTSSEADRAIEKAYLDAQIYKQITVIIVPPEQEYWVTGEVQRPGSYTLNREITLMQALAGAGRYTDFAEPTKVTINRGREIIHANADRIEEGKDQDIPIRPGDTIKVPKRWY